MKVSVYLEGIFEPVLYYGVENTEWDKTFFSINRKDALEREETVRWPIRLIRAVQENESEND